MSSRIQELLAPLELPGGLADLDEQQLVEICAEIRTFLLESLSSTGGHLSPNLGIVELTVALHRAFRSPHDRIVWDVGHQAYVHKILTGRHGQFGSLRQTGGLSGYPSRAESVHDVVENSHASTSLSYAMGLASARRAGDDSYVVAVIGDGALTGGMAYEALNHIADSRPPRMIIVLNDNGRSYAPTVGGLAGHLADLRLDPHYERTKRALGRVLREIPKFGPVADEAARRVKESFKQLVHPSTFFDVLGIKYTGPIDGHDLGRLDATLALARQMDEPVVVHVVTDKGRGYERAIEDDEQKLHGVSAFDIPTGRPLTTSTTYTDVFGEAMADLAAARPELVAVTAAMAASTGLQRMAERFPNRVVDVGICEQHAVTLAAGLAMGGLRPVVCIYSSFLQRAFDQVVMDVALHDLPVVFVIDRSGVTGPDGASHHGVFDLSYLRMVPGLSIAAPATGDELCALLATAVDMPGPVAIRYPKASVPAVPQLPVEPIPVGEWEELRQGGDTLLLATGRMVEVAGKAAVLLEERGVSCGVVNARWVKPMDPRLPNWAAGYDRIVTLEDNVATGGFGSAVLEALAPLELAGKVRVMGLPDQFLPSGDPARILASHGLDPESVADRVVG